MPWIDYINEDEAKGKLIDIYDEIKKIRGKLPNVIKIHSLKPDVIKKHMDLYISIMFGKSDLSRKYRELIAVVVSLINNCNYCIKHHAEALSHYWKDQEKLEKLIKDFNTVEFSEKTQEMLKYVFQLTKSPDKICKNDIDKLRAKGFLDRDILDINLIVSYFNFVNRIVLGLGVEFSDEEIKGYKY
jgi:uncharacterized peroxidase-related enzyme